MAIPLDHTGESHSPIPLELGPHRREPEREEAEKATLGPHRRESEREEAEKATVKGSREESLGGTINGKRLDFSSWALFFDLFGSKLQSIIKVK